MEIIERINQYWSKRADEFGDARYADMQNEKRERWLSLIKGNLPAKENIKALDLGTGAGYFSFLLKELGCKVTAIDYSQEMLKNARKNCERLRISDITYYQMDAQNLDFPDGSFDFIFTRNVTWTLPDPAKAYAEMVRVLAPGGRIVNCDANYAAGFREMDKTGQTEIMARKAEEQYRAEGKSYAAPAQGLEMTRERNDLANALYIAFEKRPAWDVNVLLDAGIQKVTVIADINQNLFNRPTQSDGLSDYGEFAVIAEKHC